MSRYRCRGIDVDVPDRNRVTDVKIPMSRYRCRDTDVEVSMLMCWTEIGITMSVIAPHDTGAKTLNIDSESMFEGRASEASETPASDSNASEAHIS